MQGEIKKSAKAYGIAAVLLAVMLGSICYSIGVFPIDFEPTPSPSDGLMKTFSSYDELRNHLMTASYSLTPFLFFGSWDTRVLATQGMSRTTLEESAVPLVNGPGVELQTSTTNIQVAGVDEADIVKVDGEYLYVVSNSSIFIIKAYPPEEAEIVSQIVLDDMTPLEIFVDRERLTVLGSQCTLPPSGYYQALFINIKTFAKIYDISDKADPTLLRTFTISGSYFNSRMIGDYVYFVASQSAYIIYDSIILPKIYSDGRIKEVSPSEIYYSNASDSYYIYTTVVAMNMQDTGEEPNRITIMLGGTSNMYVSLNNIYITFPESGGQTSIYRIQIQGRDLTYKAQGKVLGRELNQFSMDEHGDFFRIATATWLNGNPESNLYILDMNLSMVGKLENIAPNETLDSARFIGNRCYLSTSVVRRDPFFVIDVEDPANPQILGYLKIPGFTQYLHPYDTDHIIGIGKDGSKVKISLFDVSNVSAPTEIDKYTIEGDWSDTPVLTDHKAFLFSKEENLLALPVLKNYYAPYSTWQGLCVFDITLGSGLVQRGTVTHQEYGVSEWDSTYYVKRVSYIADMLYTVSDRKVKISNLNDISFVKEIVLN